MTIRVAFLTTFVAVVLTAVVAPAFAQVVPEIGGRVFGLVGGVFGDGDTTVLTSGGAGVRLTRHVGLDLEVLYAQDLGLPSGHDIVIQTFDVRFAPVERLEHSRLITFLTKMTVEFPVADGRLWPYLTGGAASAACDRRSPSGIFRSLWRAYPAQPSFRAPNSTRRRRTWR